MLNLLQYFGAQTNGWTDGATRPSDDAFVLVCPPYNQRIGHLHVVHVQLLSVTRFYWLNVAGKQSETY